MNSELFTINYKFFNTNLLNDQIFFSLWQFITQCQCSFNVYLWIEELLDYFAKNCLLLLVYSICRNQIANGFVLGRKGGLIKRDQRSGHSIQKLTIDLYSLRHYLNNFVGSKSWSYEKNNQIVFVGRIVIFLYRIFSFIFDNSWEL